MAQSKFPMKSELICINTACRARYAITDVIYNCPKCGGLLEAGFIAPATPPADLKKTWRERRMCNRPADQSGVWRYREMLPFDEAAIVTLREGNTPLLPAPRAAQYASLDAITFKHQGFNPTGSFKDNGMTCGATQAVRLGMTRVACVSTGNTSASMAAYAAAAGLNPLIFIPNGNISYGKLAQALEYGARTFQVDANFDQILALVRVLAERLGIYLLNSINPFRIEGQKTIMIEMLDQRDWVVPDWVVLPGGNLGNVSAFGKGLRELHQAGFIDRLPRDPVSWPKARHEILTTNGVVEFATEQEIADAKAVIGQCGIGCEPASAATLAGLRKLRASGVVAQDADVVAVLTGNVLKDPDYIYRYHTGALDAPDGHRLQSTFGNAPIVVPNDADEIARRIG
jgi:threonine synthase